MAAGSGEIAPERKAGHLMGRRPAVRLDMALGVRNLKARLTILQLMPDKRTVKQQESHYLCPALFSKRAGSFCLARKRNGAPR